jgi:hypothetical protein
MLNEYLNFIFLNEGIKEDIKKLEAEIYKKNWEYNQIKAKAWSAVQMKKQYKKAGLDPSKIMRWDAEIKAYGKYIKPAKIEVDKLKALLLKKQNLLKRLKISGVAGATATVIGAGAAYLYKKHKNEKKK